MKKTRIKEAVVGVAAGIALTVAGGSYIGNGTVQPDLQKTVSSCEAGPAGRIIPVNLHFGPAQFSSVLTPRDGCGQYFNPCPAYRCGAPY